MNYLFIFNQIPLNCSTDIIFTTVISNNVKKTTLDPLFIILTLLLIMRTYTIYRSVPSRNDSLLPHVNSVMF